MIIPDVVQIRNLFSENKKHILEFNSDKPDLNSLIIFLNSMFLQYGIVFLYNEKTSHRETEDYIEEYIFAYLDPTKSKVIVELGTYILNSIVSIEEHDRAINSLISLIGHELIHIKQVKRGLKKIAKNKIDQYIADPDEIMSYAWQIVNDLNDVYTKEEIINIIKSKDILAKNDNIFSLYINTFENNSKPIKLLLKRIFQYTISLQKD